jgi:uncharacterized repeat protein (TIGR03803 family)
MKPNFHRAAPALLAAALSALLVFPAAGTTVVCTTLHSFGIFTNGSAPYCALARGNDGNFYGTTTLGGVNNSGTVFQVTTNGALALIYSFTNGVDGSSPQAGLVLGSDGGFYGTAEVGGLNGTGTVFRISTSGKFTALYSFSAFDENGNNSDGGNPVASLVQGAGDLLYGTASEGGTNGEGAVFQISTNGIFTALYSFTGGNDGGLPSAALVQGNDGYYYGTAYSGGSDDFGTIFKLLSSQTFTPLYSFTNGTDGASPLAALVLAQSGTFYGTTYAGGSNTYGTVFTITSSGSFSPLYSFIDESDGGHSVAPLIQGSDLNFYGTSTGPASGFGTIFKITPAGKLTPLYDFTGKGDGAYPEAGLVQNTDGTLYGTAADGGTDIPSEGAVYGGTVYRVTTNEVFTPLVAFRGGFDGENPAAPVVQGQDGMFYGTTYFGGSDDQGVVFQMTPSGSMTLLHTFTNGPDGATPLALAPANDGSYYGATFAGGTNMDGALYHLTTNGAFTPLYSFPLLGRTEGGDPDAGLVQGSDGFFYGTAKLGGMDYGTVFKMASNGAVTLLHTFTNGIDGAYPEAQLVQGSDGNFYGTTYAGGSNGFGNVFQINSDGSSFISLYGFTNGSDGANPQAGLVQGADLIFYGTTYFGGSTSNGVVFKITSAGLLTPLYSFLGLNDGANPAAGLLLDADGNFYGTTYDGGEYGEGAVFRISSTDTFTALYSFTGGNDGANPLAALTESSDGSLYGTTFSGGIGGTGTVFQLTGLRAVPPSILSIVSTSPGLVLTWSTTPGQTYQLQYSSNLSSTNWTDLGNPVSASSGAASQTNLSPVSSPRFYRVSSSLP